MYGGVPWVLWCWFPDSRRHTSSQNQRKAKESKQDYTREIKMYLRSEQNKQLIRSITESGLSLPAIETHTQNVKSIPLNVKIWKLDGTEALLRTRLEVKTGWKRGRRQVKTGRQKYEPRQTGSRLWYSNYLLDEMEKKICNRISILYFLIRCKKNVPRCRIDYRHWQVTSFWVYQNWFFFALAFLLPLECPGAGPW